LPNVAKAGQKFLIRLGKPGGRTGVRSRLSAPGAFWQSIPVSGGVSESKSRALDPSSGFDHGLMCVDGPLRLEGNVAMANEHSVTQWLERAKLGDAAAISHLWDGYFERLVCLGREKLPDHCRRAFDDDIQEIAAEVGASTKTVECKLRLIRAIWEHEVPG
jgi:hypothetical protein